MKKLYIVTQYGRGVDWNLIVIAENVPEAEKCGGLRNMADYPYVVAKEIEVPGYDIILKPKTKIKRK